MLDWLLSGPWAPHAICLLYDPALIAALAGGDVAIWIAYAALPFLLPRLIRAEAWPRGAEALLATFVASCGIDHALHAISFWLPLYRLLAIWTGWTAVVSLVTVTVLMFGWQQMGGGNDRCSVLPA